jgi:hypothetical protein
MSATAKAERGSPRQLAEPGTRGREALRLRHEGATDAMLAHPIRDEEAGDEKRGIDLSDAEMIGEIGDVAPVHLRDQGGAEGIAHESKPGRASTIGRKATRRLPRPIRSFRFLIWIKLSCWPSSEFRDALKARPVSERISARDAGG